VADDNALATESTELLRTLIRNACVNDGRVTSGQEVRNADALEDYFAGSGLVCERYVAAPGRESLITRIEGDDPSAPVLLLMGHTDVVPANPAGWQRDPFAAEVEDGVVWGRGAIDMLNLTATMAVAVRRLRASDFRPRGTLIYLAVADEEALGTYGAGHLIEHEPGAVRADYVITESGGVPIPTSSGPLLPLTVGEKGVNWRRLVVRGVPGHGAMPFRTDNALVVAAEAVRRIAAYQPKARILDVWRRCVSELELPPEVSAALIDPERVLGAATRLEPVSLARVVHACTHTTFSPNVVHGGVAVNVIPDRVTVEVDIRACRESAPARSTRCWPRRSVTSPRRSSSSPNAPRKVRSARPTRRWPRRLRAWRRPSSRAAGSSPASRPALPTPATSAGRASRRTGSACTHLASRTRSTPSCFTATTNGSTSRVCAFPP